MAVQTVRVLEELRIASGLHPRRRFVVLRRDDGHFTWAEQYRYRVGDEGEALAEGWATLPTHGLFATAEGAAAEGRAMMSRRARQAP